MAPVPNAGRLSPAASTRRTILFNNSIRSALWPLPALAVALALAACGGGDPESLQFGLAINERQLAVDEGELVVKQGDEVTFVLDTDEGGTFHLHGYDIERELVKHETATMKFTANATGRFSITFHAGADGSHGSHGHASEHGTMFGSDTLQQGDSFSYHVMDGIDGQMIPYHNHMNHEMTASLMVSAEAENSGQAEVTIQEDGSFSPAMLSVRPGTMIVWTNTAEQRQRVVSGDPPVVTDEADSEGEEVSLGVLEVRPR